MRLFTIEYTVTTTLLMINEHIERIEIPCKKIPTLILTLNEKLFSEKSSEFKWSKKKFLGT